MKFRRTLFFNRIGGQMTILILISLLAIHAVIIASFFFSHRGEPWEPPEGGSGQFIAAVQLVAATPAAGRDPLLATMAQAFPRVQIKRAAAAPASGEHDDPRLRHLRERLGAGFAVTNWPAAPGDALTVAVKLPDGDVLSAQLPPHLDPPMLGGPIVSTVLFVVVSVTLLGFWATRALRRPLSGFAKAAEGFSLDGDAVKLPERGPEEIRAVAKAFNRMRARITKLVDDRTRVLAAMGHDLRTPITRLRLRAEFILDMELRAQMLRDLDQMKAMTDDVLSFLRDGQAREGATAIDVTSVLQTACDQFADMGYSVSYQGPDHVTIVAHPNELQRAAANLIDNAVRHGNNTVVRLSSEADGVRIDVEDDGPGIPDENKDRMLDAFVRGDASRTMDDRIGFGLGLSIARAIAEAHGGALTLHDRVPHGLIARITLPATGPQNDRLAMPQFRIGA